MSDHSYDIFLQRGRCLLSCSDEEDKDKDKDKDKNKDKDKDKMLKTPNICC